MRKLKGMTDFVLKQWEGVGNIYPFKEMCVRLYDYANFFKQPLEIWMFVPCKLVKGVWVVLDEPSHYLLWTMGIAPDDTQMNECQEYQEAKDRVLFEGFEFKGESDFSWIFKHNGLFPVMIAKRNVEYLTVILKREITLTPTAQKQLGL